MFSVTTLWFRIEFWSINVYIPKRDNVRICDKNNLRDNGLVQYKEWRP